MFGQPKKLAQGGSFTEDLASTPLLFILNSGQFSELPAWPVKQNQSELKPKGCKHSWAPASTTLRQIDARNGKAATI